MRLTDTDLRHRDGEAVLMPYAAMMPEAENCSFCGKSANKVRKLIAGPGVFICDKCIELCQEMIVDDDRTRTYALVRVPKTGWRRRIPVWHPKSWLGMALINRLCEWHWFISYHLHKVLGRPQARIGEGGRRRETGPTRSYHGLVFERFTPEARQVMILAQEEARRLNHSFIGTEHLLLGLFGRETVLRHRRLHRWASRLKPCAKRSKRQSVLRGRCRPGHHPSRHGRRRFSNSLCARRFNSGTTTSGPSTYCSALCAKAKASAAQVLVSLGADLPRVRQQVIQLLSGYQGRRAPRPGRASAIRSWSEAASRNPPMYLVCKERIVQVVRAGRRPDDYAMAYGELAALTRVEGFDMDDLDASEITITSVETTEGPGIMVAVKYKIEDDRP